MLGVSQMTDKQRAVIGRIEWNLGIEYTGGEDTKSASEFIGKYIEQSKQRAAEKGYVHKSYQQHRRPSWRKSIYNNAEFDAEDCEGLGLYGFEYFM